MKKTAILALTLLATQAASAMSTAPYLTCTFTEPFITLKLQVVNGKYETVREINPEDQPGTLYKIGSRENFGSVMILTYSDKILKVDFMKDGSDGMSDKIYSAEGILNPGDNQLYGGCELTPN